MKISYNWLTDFVTWKERDPERIAERLTAAAGEVEEVEVQGKRLEGCCVGKVLSLRKHPNADRLSVCDVQTDRGIKHVVCGGTNLREGMRVAFAHVGTKVYGPDGKAVFLEKAKIRGEESEGMICSSPELRLEERFPIKPEQGSRPIMDLGDGDAGVSSPLAESLDLDDLIFHVDNHALTNRADLFSHVGFARECVALGLATWKKSKTSKPPAFSKTPLPFRIIPEEKTLVPRYLGCSITIDALGETPAWMRRRLEALGSRSLSLPIDITNYVMLEWGVPLHSFDMDDLTGDIRIRSSREGDEITTLDGEKRVLPPGAIVLRDDRGIFDLLPIMGGLRSSTKCTTRHIYLQSVSALPSAVRAGIIGTGLRTEAATIAEKGIPHVRVQEAFFRALELFLSLVPGAKVASKLVSWGTNGAARPIPFSVKQAEKALGMSVSSVKARKILTDLGFKVGRGTVTPPLWRIRDCSGPHDLTEEIGRILGYGNVPVEFPRASITPPPRDQRINLLRDDLKAAGFIELLPLSLLGPDLLAKCRLNVSEAPALENAIGAELSLLQTSTLPQLLVHASQNLLQVEDAVRTFTCSHVFSKKQGEWMECGVLIAERRTLPLGATPFLALKQIVLGELTGSGIPAEVKPAGTVPSFGFAQDLRPFGHPGRSADLIIDGKAMGLLCELHPSVTAAFDLPGRAAVALLDLESLLALPESATVYTPLPAFPAVAYDLTMTLDAAEKSADILAKIRRSSPLLVDVSVVDLFEGGKLQKGQYNLTVRCTYRADDRTLTEEEVKREHGKVLEVVDVREA